MANDLQDICVSQLGHVLNAEEPKYDKILIWIARNRNRFVELFDSGLINEIINNENMFLGVLEDRERI